MVEESAKIALSTVTFVAATVFSYFYIQRRRSKESVSWKEVLRKTKQQSSSSSMPPASSATTASSPLSSSSSSNPDDAWEERRRRGITAASLHVKKDATSEKPFGSSYYYAHNNSKTTGGYKDGLRMDDFTMNGPRLLSRGGKPVANNATDSEPTVASESDAPPPAKSQTKKSLNPKRCLVISRYLWDDPGSGVATIRIDDLPGKTSSQVVHWKETSASVTGITAELIDEGLLVRIETSTEVDYRLRIQTLYGKVDAVEAVNKQKRLLVRLTKKQGILNKSNAKAWPHPQKKKS